MGINIVKNILNTNVNNALEFSADENNILQYLKIIYKNS
jgi:hypothetical protein